jgi:DNA-binding MarR family transcriptional regulator
MVKRRTPRLLDETLLRPSAALLGAQIAMGAAIERDAVADSPLDATTLDLLVRIDLSPDGGIRAVELCRQLLLSPSHISRVIDRAEADGLVVRSPDPDDRRAQRVMLTDSGRAAVGDFAPRLHGVLDRVIHQTLTSDEIDQLVAMLERIETAARTVPDALAGPARS